MTPKRLALVTGATRALGKAIAERLLLDGCDVILTYATDDACAETVQRDFTSAYPKSEIFVVKADAADFISVDILDSFLNKLGRSLDVLILNAGVTDRDSFRETSRSAWQRVLDANLNVPVFTVQRLVSRMARGSSVIFTGSLMGLEPHSTSLAYGVSKAAVHALTKNLVKFLSPHDIRVNCVAPGFVDTEWQRAKSEEIRASITSKISMARFATPDEIAGIYLTLINSTYLTGETIFVDGGYSYR